MTESPIADATEKRPPTQSQNSNMFVVSIPNARTASELVLSATKCFLTASWPSACTNHSRATRAFANVSTVVKVFDATTNIVSSGFSPWMFAAKSAGSTLETKWHEMPSWRLARRASYTMAGPRSLPPIPILTIWQIRLPVLPMISPDRIPRARSAMRSRTACTAGATFTPSIRNVPSFGIRKAMWPTARPSVELTRSPFFIR